MPKDPSSRSLLSPKSQGTLYRPYASHGRGVSQGGTSKDGEETARKDWEDVTCPICMEHPHNAVLLLCSSHDKGCRPYMCDSSYRHSNCLDQYRKAKATSDKNSERVTEASVERIGGEPVNLRDLEMTDEAQGRSFGPSFRGFPIRRVEDGSGGVLHERTLPRLGRAFPIVGPERLNEAESRRDAVERGTTELSGSTSTGDVSSSDFSELTDLLCPLCRGKVLGLKVVHPARHYLNRKQRSCAQEACAYTGSYEELRKHARDVHPSARPAEIDPARQRDWRRLERQRDLGDVLSTIRSAMPGATVLGDYVIDDEDEEHEDDGDDSDFPGDDGNWWTVFLLFQVFGPAASLAGGRGLPGRMRQLTRGPSGNSLRQALWGENFQGSGVGGVSNLSGNAANAESGPAGSTSRRRRSRQRSRGDML